MAFSGRTSGSPLLVATLGLLVGAVATAPTSAQGPGLQSPVMDSSGTGRPGIRIAPVILAEPEVETAVSIQVFPESAIPRQTFLRIRNLPLAAKLSEGHVVTAGIWAVPLSALPQLRLMAPLSSSGRTELQLALVGLDGSVLAETKTSLVVAPAWLLGSGGARVETSRPAAPPAAPQAAPRSEPAGPPSIAAAAQPPAQVREPAKAPVAFEKPAEPTVSPQPRPVAAPVAPPAPPAPVVAALPPPAAPAQAPPAAPAARPAPAQPPAPAPAAQQPPAPKGPPVLSAADRERAEGMVQRGDGFLRQGNLAAARQFFRRAADMGLAAGALRLGATYDPAELGSISIVGIKPEPKEAAQWYERARELGAPEAGARLSRLQGR